MTIPFGADWPGTEAIRVLLIIAQRCGVGFDEQTELLRWRNANTGAGDALAELGLGEPTWWATAGDCDTWFEWQWWHPYLDDDYELDGFVPRKAWLVPVDTPGGQALPTCVWSTGVATVIPLDVPFVVVAPSEGSSFLADPMQLRDGLDHRARTETSRAGVEVCITDLENRRFVEIRAGELINRYAWPTVQSEGWRIAAPGQIRRGSA